MIAEFICFVRLVLVEGRQLRVDHNVIDLHVGDHLVSSLHVIIDKIIVKIVVLIVEVDWLSAAVHIFILLSLVGLLRLSFLGSFGLVPSVLLDRSQTVVQLEPRNHRLQDILKAELACVALISVISVILEFKVPSCQCLHRVLV